MKGRKQGGGGAKEGSLEGVRGMYTKGDGMWGGSSGNQSHRGRDGAAITS